jgi:hypothetical protein
MASPSGRSARPRRKRVFRTRRKIGWTWLRQLPLLWLAAVGGCLFLLYFFVGSGYFSVRTVNAGNLTQSDLNTVITRCQCVGDNIFTLRSDVIRKRLDGIPSLIVQRVYTRLPNQIVVQAVYKPRVAIWRTPEAAYAVASDGQVLRVWRSPFPKHAWDGEAIFDEGYDSTVKKGKRLVVGEHVGLVPLTIGLSLRNSIPAALRAQVKTYYYRPIIGFTVEGKAGWWALFGMNTTPQLVNARISALQAALSATPSAPPDLGPGDCVDLRDSTMKNWYMRQDHNCA